MHRILRTVRLFPTSFAVRLNSSSKIPVRNQLNIDDDDNDDDDKLGRRKTLSAEEYIYADSKSARFKEKNRRKQKQWVKNVEQRKITPPTPLSPLLKETKTTSEASEKNLIRDTYVTPDGVIREDNYPIRLDEELEDEEHEKEPDEPVPLAQGGRHYPVWYYAEKLRKLASENKVEETLDYFYNEMMDKQRVAPNLFCYQVVIGICARNGYLTQAFNLYREMKDRGFTTVDSRKMSKVFTLLATACYRASDSGMAVNQATAFLDEMKEKGFRIEYRTFNAFIAAFGKHGQLKMAFQLADEMVEVGFVPNEDTYASLLIACSSEKVAGFKYAIEIWRRMLAFGIRPSPFHFGLLLNITHHCGLGSPESMHKLLLPAQRISLDDEETNAKEHKAYSGPSFLSGILTPDEQSRSILEQQQSSDSTEMISQQDASTSSEITSEWWQDATDIRQGHLLDTHLRPFSNASILKPSVSYEQKNLVALRMPRSPAERLMLLGGIPGVLKHMQEHKVAPNNIIFNTFLNLIPSVTEHEQALIHVSNVCEVKPNIQFYNMLIQRRIRRRAKQEALEVLDLMREQCLSPDLYTFSALAKGCSSRPDAEQLLNEITDLNLKPNQKILDSMLKNAFFLTNFPLLAFICESHRTHNLPVNEDALRRIEKFLLDTRSKILAMEQANVDNEQYRLLSSTYDRFRKFYEKWLRTVPYAKRFDQKISYVFDKPDLKK